MVSRFRDGSVDCVITDPPFGINNHSKQAVTEAGKHHARKIANDETPEIAIQVFKDVMDALLPKTAETADMYVFTNWPVLADWIVMTREYLPTHGFMPAGMITWRKERPGQGAVETNPWGLSTEYILFFQKGPRVRTVKRRVNVLEIDSVHSGKNIHPHEKPQALLEHLINTSTVERDFIVDPFGGSGSLARAARSTGRSAVCIELDQMNYELATEKFNSQEASFF
jgi:adenine-specific DNA-methyltransferase